MLYLKATKDRQVTKWPISIYELKKLLQSENISVPDNLESVDLTHLGYYAVTKLTPPPVSGPYKKIKLGEPHWDGYKFIRTFVEVDVFNTWDDVRAERNRLLRASDWTQLADAPLDTVAKKAWAAYRTKLRDLVMNDTISFADVAWPQAPDSK